MELRHLRYFVAVAEELHFGKAAKRLCITQQPLSRQIKDLEEELGVELFYRTKRTVRLTEVGEIFLVETKKILQQADRAVELVKQASQGKIGRITVGFTGSALNIVLPTTVCQFKQLYPQVDLTLKRMQTPEQVEALNNGQIDLGLLHPPINNDGLILETIYQEQLVVALPDNHPLANVSKTVSLQQLANESFILFPRHVGSVLYDRIINLCQQTGFSPNVVQEAIPQQTILGLVAAGIGISLIHSSVRTLGIINGVVFRDLIESTPILETAVAWNCHATNPVLPSFVKIVRQKIIH